MSEISSSDINKNLKTAPAINNTQKTSNGQKEEDALSKKEMTEYNNPGADALGRAMLNTDNFDKDLDKILKNPKILDISESLYDLAIAEGATPEEAALIATEGW